MLGESSVGVCLRICNHVWPPLSGYAVFVYNLKNRCGLGLNLFSTSLFVNPHDGKQRIKVKQRIASLHFSGGIFS